MLDRYALLDLPEVLDEGEARWWLFIDGRGWGGTPYLNDRPMTEGAERGWFSAPADPGVEPETWLLEVERPGGRPTTHYVRTLEIADDAYPEELTVEEYSDRVDDESTAYDSRVAALYTAVTEQLPSVREAIEGPWLRLDGEPPPSDGLTWLATLPHALRNRREYLHLFPGELRGFRETVAAALEQLGGVTAHTHGGGPLSVYVKVTLPKRPPLPKWTSSPYRPGMTRQERKAAKDAAESRTEKITRHLDVPVSDGVQGMNRAQAVAVWDELLAEIVDYVRAITAVLCPTCGGHGFIEPAHDHEEAPTT